MRGENYLPHALKRTKTKSLFLFFMVLTASLFASNPHTAIINEGDVFTHCLDTTVLAPDAPAYIMNNCADAGGESVNFTFDDENWCVTYEGTAVPGIDTACVVLCNSNFNCDTTYFYITTLPTPPVHMDTVVINGTSSACLLDFPNLTGDVTFMENICNGNSPQTVDFEVTDKFCVAFTGLELGVGRACINASNNSGTDFTYVDVFVRMPEPEFISVEVEEEETIEICAEDLELYGGNLTASFICDESQLFTSTYSVDDNCFSIEGKELGSDLVCAVICDDLNICDTIELEVTVMMQRETIAAPELLDDEFDVIAGEEAVLTVCLNDMIPTEEAATMSIIGIPNIGTASVDEVACEITYESIGNTCDQVDSIEYEICNSAGCDQAVLYLNITCESVESEELAVVGGFSPNGDDKNETLVITGLDKYPNHRLTVFNRYGAKLMEAEQYQSDWDGKWDGQEIPDGVYYYLLDTGEGEKSSGWFVVQR